MKLKDKIVFVMLIIAILGNFIFLNSVQAQESTFKKATGTLMEPICDFVTYLRRCYIVWISEESISRSANNY